MPQSPEDLIPLYDFVKLTKNHWLLLIDLLIQGLEYTMFKLNKIETKLIYIVLNQSHVIFYKVNTLSNSTYTTRGQIETTSKCKSLYKMCT